jgi:hypothetical protein
MAVIDRDGPDLDPMFAGIRDDLGRRVEAHRLGVEQRGAEDIGMMVLHPAACIGDLGEAGGMALGKAIGAEALDLLEGALGEILTVAARHHAADQLVVEMADPAGHLEGRHGAAQLIGLGRGEARADDGDLHRLLLEEGHAQRFSSTARSSGLGYSAFSLPSRRRR